VNIPGRHEGFTLDVIAGIQGHRHVATHQMHHNQATLHLLAQISFTQPQEEAASLIAEHAKRVVGVYGVPQIRPAI